MVVERIKNYVETQKKDIIDDCIEIINIPSISHDYGEVKKALHLIIDKAKSMGFDAYCTENDSIGIVEFGHGEETIGVLVHIDVVPAGDENDWDNPPFSSVYKDGYIWGRGSVDDKGPAIASLYALKTLKELGFTPSKKIRMIIGTQEEVDWKDIKTYKEHNELPDYGFTPDGEFPIINAEKGFAQVNVNFRRNNCTGDFDVISFDGGISDNVIPPKANIIIKGDKQLLNEKVNSFVLSRPEYADKIIIEEQGENINIKTVGKAAHSSVPELGINAIYILVELLSTLELKDEGMRQLIDFSMKEIINNKNKNPLNLDKTDDETRTSIAATLARCTSDEYTIAFNLRMALKTFGSDVEKCFSIAADKYKFDFNMDNFCMEPISVNKDTPFLRQMAKAYEELSGLKAEFITSGGTSYAKAMPNTVSFGPIFPGEIDLCHQNNERISLDNLVKCINMYAYLLYLTAVEK
ncbi:Sapep family Mn(2+)-dependent dipeptidase [Clostridium oryzae]|uniref:Putative dipeptidase n=1 Tax=Clostridium oryzae TaxID=1450648 RepID=A0A1V4IMC9_9CLOT|nr:Sapep family Mn(2+)-dependent dipeptidase [Clostridium oryzae]OPJ60990.1 putative dipeptidase [Clostridium oryzae]